jgi:hypothetical protein
MRRANCRRGDGMTQRYWIEVEMPRPVWVVTYAATADEAAANVASTCRYRLTGRRRATRPRGDRVRRLGAFGVLFFRGVARVWRAALAAFDETNDPVGLMRDEE